MYKVFLAGLMGMLAASVSAAETTTAGDPAEFSQRLAVAEYQDLKYRVLQLEADAAGALPAAQGLVAIYVNSLAPSLKLRHIAISIDGKPLAEQDVDDAAFHALGGPDRLIRVGAVRPDEQGVHTLHAEFQALTQTPDGPAESLVTLDESLDGKDGATAISLSLEPSRVVSPIRIALKRYRVESPKEGWALQTLHEVGRFGHVDGSYVAGDPGDPEIAYVEYLRNSGRADEAALDLLRLAGNAGGARELSPLFWLRTAAVLREIGLWNYSRAICARLDAAHQEEQAVAVERLNIALQDYDAGDVPQAESELVAIKDRIPEDRVQDWQLGYAQILFLHDQYRQAESVLQDRDQESTEAFRYTSQSAKAVQTTAFRHYNLAVAMVHNGEEQRGLSLLDLIGRIKTLDRDLVPIRNQANLALGWHFLRKKQGITAMGVLRRVSIKGPASEPALLGMGWAQLAPAGEKIARVRLDRESGNALAQIPAPLKHSLTELGVFDPELDNLGGPTSFEHGDPPQDRDEGLKRALVFWEVLAQRDPRSPAVREGLLAIAYARDCLGDNAAAKQAYAAAIAGLEAQKAGLGRQMDAIRTAGMSVLVDRVADAGGKAVLIGEGYLAPTEGNRSVFAAVERYRALGMLAQTVAQLASQAGSLARTGDAVFNADRARFVEDQISRVRDDELKGIQALALQDLEQQAKVTDQYLQEAYFAAARASDQTVAFDRR